MRTSVIVLMLALGACSSGDEPFKLKIYSSGPDRSSEPAETTTIFAGREDEPETCTISRKLAYAPTVVELTGNVVDMKYYGPPNYGETPNEDRVEGVLILMLDESFSISEVPESVSNEEQACVDRVQLVIHGNAPFPKAGEHISLKGTLFGAWSGHHRTKVLLETPPMGGQVKK